MQDVSKHVGREVSFGGSSATPASDMVQASSASQAAEALETVEQMQSHVFQAQKAGFKAGAHITKREAEVAALWKIAGYDGSTVSLLQQEMGLDVGEPVVVEVQELLAEWKIYKGTVTEPLPGWNFESNPCSPLASAVWKYDYAKSAVVMAVREVFEHMYITTKDLALFVKPNAVRVSSAWKVGELMIAPASTRIERKDAPGSICVGKFDLGGPGLEPLFLAPSFANPLNAKGEPNPASWVSPFWHVPGPATKSQKPTMTLKVLSKSIGAAQVRVPILVNIKALAEDDYLVWDKSVVKSFGTCRTYVDEADFTKVVKRRKM